MSAGYGRGYYGNAQLEQGTRRSRRGWIVALVGIGAAVWLMWPRSSSESAPDGKPDGKPKRPSTNEELEELARARGFSSAKLYEDALVSNARELQAAGADVVLAPHLRHLAPLLE